MRFDRFDYTVWAVLGLLSAALALVLFIGDQVGVRIVNTVPADGGEIAALGRIGVEFALPMQTRSVETRFEIDPPAAGRFEWQARQLWFIPLEALQAGGRYTARLRAGAASLSGPALKKDFTWTFRVRAPWIVYISPANSPRELWRISSAGGPPEQLTNSDGRVYDFAVSRDGAQVAYSVVNDQNGIDLWLTTEQAAEARVLVNCGPDRCSTPAWSPDGARLAYSRESQGLSPNAPHGPPRVWTVDLQTEETAQLYQDSQVLGYGPSWSPDGRRLAFFDGGAGGIRVLDVQTSEEMVLASWMGIVGTWSPDGTRMMYNDLSSAGESTNVTVYLAEFTTRQVTRAMEQAPSQADFSVPAWSPDGEWIAASLRLSSRTPNEELWLMRPDGSEAHAITQAANYTYGAYRWDVSGRSLVFQRLELGTPYPQPEIMLWSLGEDEPHTLVVDGTLPAWMP